MRGRREKLRPELTVGSGSSRAGSDLEMGSAVQWRGGLVWPWPWPYPGPALALPWPWRGPGPGPTLALPWPWPYPGLTLALALPWPFPGSGVALALALALALVVPCSRPGLGRASRSGPPQSR